jgi:HAE1 family hydrophobic/amphiphilic exporter-1
MEPAEQNDHPPSRSGTRLADFSIRYPVTICMVFVSAIALGVISIFRIPLVLFPAVDFPEVFIRVPYRNATPGQIQQSITKPLEEALSTVPGVQRMMARTNSDSTWVSLIFDWGVNIDVLRAQIREKIDQVRGELPADVEHIRIQTFGTEDIPILEGRISSRADLRKSYDLLDLKIKKPLERVPGVAEVELYGAQRREVGINLRLDDLKRYRVNVDQLFRSFNSINQNWSVGRVVDGQTRYGAVAQGHLGSAGALDRFPVNDRGLQLDQIAEIDFDTPLLNSGRRLNGDYAIGFNVRKTSEANTVETVRRVLAKIAELNDDPSLSGVGVIVWHNAGAEITKAITGLLSSGTLGALLAVFVLIFFLRRLGATLAIGFAIPFSIVAAIGFLYLSGNTLNVLSMMGLMLATGMLVDNAVVVLESIYQKLEKGMDRVQAARVGTEEVLTAVIASSLTSIIIFVPLIFGKKTNFSIWLSNAGIAIIIALLCSLFISITLIPLVMARFLRIDPAKQTRLQLMLRRRAGFLARRSGPGWSTDRYLSLIAWPLQHRFLAGLVLAPLMVAGSVWLLKAKVPDNTPEAQELQNLSIQYQFSENFHYAKIEADYVEPVEKFLLANKERFKIKDVLSSYSNDQAYTSIYFDKDRITLSDMKSIREEIGKELPFIPGAKITLGAQRGAENQNWIGLNLFGDEPEVLNGLAAAARARLLRNPQFRDVFTPLDRALEEVQIKLNRPLARRYGISPQSVSNILSVVVRGQQLRSFATSEGETELWVRMRREDLRRLNDLNSLVVGSGPEGEEILLSHVAEFRIQRVPAMIDREDRRTSARLWAIYTGDKRDEGKQQVTEVMNSLEYPAGYGWSYGFWTQRSEQEDREFYFNIFLALFMVYFVMASLFESLAHPLAIMFSLPFAAVGVAWFLFLTGTPFNIMSQIGLMVLIGIVVNNGIVMIDHINNLRRKGLPREEAIREGCRERFRPILMTASTTVVGLIPLAFGDSGLLDLRYFPMARTIMGGLAASTILTLVVLPTYYTLFDDLAVWVKRTWYASGRPPLPDAGGSVSSLAGGTAVSGQRS